MKRLLALAIAVAFSAGVIGCSGGTTTAPKVAPRDTHTVSPGPKAGSTEGHVTPSTHSTLPPPSTGPSLPPVTSKADTGKGETKK